MFAGISLIINSKAVGMIKTMRYTHKFRTWLNWTLLYRDLWNKIPWIWQLFQAWKLQFFRFAGFSWPYDPYKSNGCTLSIKSTFLTLFNWSSPSSNHMPDLSPRFISGTSQFTNLALGYLIKSIALNRPVCVFCITNAVSVLWAYKPCPREARHFRLTLFCSLFKVY